MEIVNDSPLRSYVVQILNAADRAAHLTRDLLTFSRKEILQTKAVDLNHIIQSIQERLSRIIGEDIEFATKLSDRELPIMADEIQIEQILMNLATNARDAMPNGGNLIIKTELVEVDNEFISIYGDFKPGPYAVIHFEDTGSGIENKIKERIFEPFFSTKDTGKGTGLGLAIVYGIVKQHGGFINVYSEPKSGTTVKIYLPIIEAKIEIKVLKDIPSLPGGTETILIGEDDPQVRTLLKEILLKAGYDILEAKNGEDVLRVFKEAEDRVKLILLDVIMPKKNGKEVYDEIQKTRPDLKILFISGYSTEIMIKRGLPEKGLVLLSKPISPHDLLKKIREMLD
jgi:CheY-like chemotaxis protein